MGLLLTDAVLVVLFLTFVVVPPASSSVAVLDSRGNALKVGESYYIQPEISIAGGLTMAPPADGASSCPLDVVQASSEVDRGIPVMFFPYNSSFSTVVPESELLYVIFPVPTPCNLSTTWKFDSSVGRVTTGGTRPGGFVDPQTSRFVVQRFDRFRYTLRYCPCKYCRMGCLELGINNDGRLGGDQTPSSVVFHKAERRAVHTTATLHPVA